MGPLDAQPLYPNHRCFVTAVTVVDPSVSLFHSIVSYREDHGRGTLGLTGSFYTAAGHTYRVGDVINVKLDHGNVPL